MTRNVSAVALGATMLVTTVVLAVVGVRSVTNITNAILQASLKTPDSPAFDALISNFGSLIIPLLFCLATPIALFLMGSIMAFRGELTISYRKSHLPSPI